MGRLIDADNIKGYAKYIKTNEKFEPYIMIDDLSKLLDEQPTAYSVENVVDELESELEKENIAIDLGEFRLFEIVKHGGMGKDVEQMKATGIVRRFDDLGRIVIPKELRRQIFGTPKTEDMLMEIFMDKDTIVLRKYEENKADDVCEWKSESDGEFIRNPHTRRTFSNEPSMKNVYCNTCGKKIKIVGD